MAVFEHECFARACPIHFFPRTRANYFHTNTRNYVCVKISHRKIVLASPLKLATTGLKILFDHCQMTSSRLINVVFVDENQIGKTRSNGDQQYDIKSHASDGQTKYEAHCTIARKRLRPVGDRGLLDLDRPDWLRISNSSFRHEHP